jgi:hypothetical protein
MPPLAASSVPPLTASQARASRPIARPAASQPVASPAPIAPSPLPRTQLGVTPARSSIARRTSTAAQPRRHVWLVLLVLLALASTVGLAVAWLLT